MSLWLSTSSMMGPSIPPWLEETVQKLTDNEKSLRTVELTQRRIDDVCARILARAMDENTVVTAFILSCFSIVDDGAAAIGSVLGKNKSIQKLQLRDLRNSREVTTFFQSLLQNTVIQELSLRHTLICPVGAKAIAKLFATHSALTEVRITDSQLVGGTSTLKILCDGLKSSPSIQRVYLVNVEIPSSGATPIAKMLSDSNSIQELHLCENQLGDEGVAVLAEGALQSRSLRVLDLRSNDITPGGVLSLQGLIVRSKTLQSLNLANNELGNDGTAALARGLQQSNCRLQKLDVSSNGIDHVGATSISTMLRVNHQLSELNLSFNSIGDKGAVAMACALQRNTTLRRLSLRRNGIHNTGATALAKKLPKMQGLRELLLSKNHIDSEGASALLDGLRSNTELEYLHVEDTQLSEPVSKEIVRWIRLNKAGRRIFRTHKSVPPPLWTRVYGRISSDADTLFHFIVEKPDVLPCGKTLVEEEPGGGMSAKRRKRNPVAS
jgi:Ran GTPase-activating protein (RanGAP) involved in mRNA processing and transport